MKSILKYVLLALACTAPAIREVKAQQASDSVTVPLLTADSLASGNYKDILLSFFQLAASNLTGPNKEFSFTSTPFAVMLHNNPDLLRYDNYMKTKWARKFNFVINARLDSLYHFDGFATGITYAIVNNRDYTISSSFVSQVTDDSTYKSAINCYNHLMARIRKNAPEIRIFDQSFKEQAVAAFKAKYPDLPQSEVKAFSDAYIAKESELDAMIGQLDQKELEYRETCNDLARSIDGFTDASRQINLTKTAFETELNAINTSRKRLLAGLSTQNIDGDMAAAFDTLYYNVKDVFCFNMTTQIDISPVVKYDDTLRRLLVQMMGEGSDKCIEYLLSAKDTLTMFERTKIQSYDKIIEDFQTKGLWTVTLSDTSYSNGELFKNVKLSTEYLKGMSKHIRDFNFEFTGKGYISVNNDTVQESRNLQRTLVGADAGFNMVLRGKKTKQSYLEFKAALSYSGILRGAYTDEDKQSLDITGTLRIRVFNEVWIPVDIRYDPANGKVFGFLAVKTNFKALGF